MNSIVLLHSLLILAFALLLPFAAASASVSETPNIVLIFTDDQGYRDVGCFGAKDLATPNLDRMAAEGRRFTNFHVAQPVCSASRAALLTGCYPNRIGIHGALGPGARHGLSSNEVTLARLLKQRGYATGMAGKWHLGHHAPFLPARHGFDEYLGIPYSNDMWPRHPEAKPGTYPPLPLIESETVINPDVTPQDQKELTRLFTQRAVQFIEKHSQKPFFFYLAHPMPHVPLFVSDIRAGKSLRGLYGDVIEEIDWSVGEILRTLRQQGIDRNTLVIFTSDNGPWLSYGQHAGSAHPLREGKGTVWEGGTRVPCIMRWPGRIPAGSATGAMLMTIDLLPTIAHLLQAPLPAHPIDGKNLWPLMVASTEESAPKNPHAGYAWYYHQNELQAVSSADGRWKLVFPHTYRTLHNRAGGANGIPVKYDNVKITSPQLYNLEQDISETADVAASHPDIVRQLSAYAETVRAELGDALTARQGSGLRPPGQLPSN